MNEQEFDLEKKLAELKNKFKLEEIKFEKQSRIDVENLKMENMKSLHRLKRADKRREITGKY